MKKRKDKVYLTSLTDDLPFHQIVFAPNKSIAIKKYKKYHPEFESIPIRVRELTPFERWLFKDELKEVKLSSKPVLISEYCCLEIPPNDWEEIPGKARVLNFYLEKKGIMSESEGEE